MKKMILWALATMAATGSAQSPVDWNSGDPVLQLQKRLSEQPPVAAPASARPVSVVADNEEKEPSAIVDPALAGDYRLKEIVSRGFPENLRSHYCPDRLEVVIDGPSRVVVLGQMENEEGRAYPWYFVLKSFSPSRLVKAPDEVDRGAATETVFDGKEVRTTHNGFMLLILSVVHEYTGLRLTGEDILVWKHSETIVPAGAILSNDEDYTCHYARAAR